MTFRLFHVPYVVLREVLDSMQIADLTCLALCSTKSYFFVKTSKRKSPHLNLLVTNDCGDFTGIDITFGIRTLLVLRVYKHDRTEIVKVHGDQIPFFRRIHWLFFNYNDDSVGFKNIVNFAKNLFSIDIYSVICQKQTLWTLDWLNTKQTHLQRIQAEFDLSSEEYFNLLTQRIADDLVLFAVPPEDFRYSGPFEDRELIWIKHGKWITADNLVDMKSKQLDIESSKLTSSSVNQYLKAWANGRVTETKYAAVRIDNFDFEVALEGLKAVDVIRKCCVQRSNGDTYWFISDYEIQKEDGVKTFVGYHSGTFLFSTL